jgi:hypothetical protein
MGQLRNVVDDANSAEARDTMIMFGGLALVLLGTGMILSSPAIRKYLGGLNVGNLLQTAAPDFERYLKLKAM